jgi:penicillin-binding protein 2
MQNWLSENFPPNRSAQNNLSSGLFDKTRTVGRGNQSWVLIGIIGMGLIGGIGSRLAYLQLEQGAKNRQIAENNRVRTVAKPPVMRRPSKPTYGSKQRRLEGKSQRSSIKASRGKVTD